MSLQRDRQTPATYIHYQLMNPSGISEHRYEEQLKELLQSPADNADETLLAFKEAAQLNPDLTSHFYSAVCDVFKKLRHGVDHAQRWDKKMEAFKTLTEEDPTLLKYIRELLLGKAIPALVASQSTMGSLSVESDFQVASDILFVSGTSPDLADAIKPEWVHPLVLWHFKQADQKFAVVAPRFQELRLSPPFENDIVAFENKHHIHVDCQALDTQSGKNLVVEFNDAHHDIAVSIVDVSPRHRAHHAHQIELHGADTPYREQIAEILSRSHDLPDQDWVKAIAMTAACALE